ncbi:PAQR family membrane homeostasis protein TrhA [Sulfurimonas sp.]|uniref:PAQR family membrane homeostasis protein TrhA n=1 Tax=Sulfurimonas sp. TaxID=2022749 RepID=UPI002B471066|nr:hemolysin III family protein [Sulfurimonas sp.]
MENINNFSLLEEIWHAISHGLGLALSIAGLAILVSFASISGSTMAITSSAIFGTTLILMYGSSTLYHAITHKHTKELFQKFDHASIYFLIAGSYTPITLVSLAGVWGYSIASAVWATAIFGIYMKFTYPNRFEKLSLFLYLIMGWSIVVAIEPLSESMEKGGIYLLIAGGLSYTFGVFFYINDHKKFYHAIWHLFVLGGSIFHFFMTLFYII